MEDNKFTKELLDKILNTKSLFKKDSEQKYFAQYSIDKSDNEGVITINKSIKIVDENGDLKHEEYLIHRFEDRSLYAPEFHDSFSILIFNVIQDLVIKGIENSNG